MFIKDIPSKKTEIDGEDEVYKFDDIIKFYDLKHKLSNHCYLFINTKNNINDILIRFALFQEHSGIDDVVFFKLIFSGHGFGGNLKEMRHTYFSNNGYIFYLPAKAIVESLNILSDYFDFD